MQTLLDPNWDEYTPVELLRKVRYWIDRFEVSRDVDHLECAERYADAVRPYLPTFLQELPLRGLYNLYSCSYSEKIGGEI